MRSGLLKRIERLEEELARERASRTTWKLVWIDEAGKSEEAVEGDRSC
jgi:hypothetical protein